MKHYNYSQFTAVETEAQKGLSPLPLVTQFTVAGAVTRYLRKPGPSAAFPCKVASLLTHSFTPVQAHGLLNDKPFPKWAQAT